MGISRRNRIFANGASNIDTHYCPFGWVEAFRNRLIPIADDTEGDLPIVFIGKKGYSALRKPKRPHKRDDGIAREVLTRKGARPNSGIAVRTVRLLWVKLLQFFCHLCNDLLSPLLDIVRKTFAVFLRVFKRALLNEHRNGVEIARVGFAAEPLRFKGNRTATTERVEHLGRLPIVGIQDVAKSLVDPEWFPRVFPLAKFGNERLSVNLSTPPIILKRI